MEKDRQTKIIAIVALFIGVVSLTVGFGAFSARLVIQSKAKVSPDASSFKVLLSKEQNSVVVGSVNPIGNGGDATINNNDAPTISGLKANFINPGEKVVYEFYAVNTGDLDAFLNKIDFINIIDKSENKVCTAGEGTTASYVESACNSIRVTVKVGTDDKACQTSTYGAHKLEKKNGEKVVVTIEYNKDGVRADGPFSVEFGDITLIYSTVDTETKNVPDCDEYVSHPVYGLEIKDRTNIVDNDNDGKISLSDKVTLGTESFYVMSTDEAVGTVTMFSEWNLNVGSNQLLDNSGKQNSECKGWTNTGETKKCTIAFSETNYWDEEFVTYPVWVYGPQSNLYSYVENYITYLKEEGYTSVIARLISYSELISLGCVEENGVGVCDSAPVWVRNTTFWSGTAMNSNDLWGQILLEALAVDIYILRMLIAVFVQL